MNMHADEESDEAVRAEKRPNKGGQPPAEAVEQRASPKGNGRQTAAARTLRRSPASNGLAAVRLAAQRNKQTRFTALLHHITIDLLKQSFRALERNAAPGIDGMTWHAYQEENLEGKLLDLHGRIHRGSYRARPAKRTYIPKADGSQRPLDILCLEDKIVQQAVVYVLEAIYEADFLGFSYGFRSGRGQHDALDALYAGLMRKRVNWVLDADIQGFFSAMSHNWTLRFLEHRIADKRILRLIAKWLKVGVVTKEGRIERSMRGASQGAVVSPTLANVYLHYALDLWAHRWRQNKARGDVIIIRYADDFIASFQNEHEARAFLQDLHERLREFELALHPAKTRLIRFGRFAAEQRKKRGEGKPETFDFLGFTHFCTRSKAGGFVIGRKTIKKRMVAKLKALKVELRKRMHESIVATGEWLNLLLKGHLNYFAVPGNSLSLWWFFHEIRWRWLRSLRRRSQKANLSWEKFHRLTDRFFPPIKILHPQPLHRFDARTQGRSPVR
jgi:group II intron reverse transcriptase/maturase